MDKKTILILSIALVVFLAGCACDAICDMIKDGDHCYQKIAVISGDPSECEKIEDPAPKSKCYLQLAEKKGDKTLCYSIPVDTWTYTKAECFQLVAIKNNDMMLCYSIGEGEDSRSDMTTPGVRGVSRDICIEEIEKRCGDEGQPCCSMGGLCDFKKGLICDGVCKKSSEFGKVGTPCDSQGGCDEGAVCNSNNICVENCGKLGEYCCGGQHINVICPGDSLCDKYGMCSPLDCGQNGKKPCTGIRCDAGTFYNAQEKLCLDCGIRGYRCCDTKCSIGTCENGMCN